MAKESQVLKDYYEPFLRGQNKRTNNYTDDRMQILENMYIRNLSELCANRFQWPGLPEEIDLRFLELELFTRARGIFMEHPKENDKYVFLRADGYGWWDYQNNPTSYTYTGNDILSGQVDADKCVPVWANYNRVPDIDTVYIYATKLAEIDRTIEINTMSARLTKIIAADENARLSMANIHKQIAAGEPVVYVTNGFDPANITVMDLGVNPDGIISMQMVKNRVWNEAMTLLGINNANQDKKERMITDEVGANDSQVEAFRDIALNARRQAAEKINEKYGLSVSVEFTSDEREVEETEEQQGLEGGENGGIHDEVEGRN